MDGLIHEYIQINWYIDTLVWSIFSVRGCHYLLFAQEVDATESFQISVYHY